MYNAVVARLSDLGYTATQADTSSITFLIGKVEWEIKNNCNISTVPAGLTAVAVDMVCGMFFNQLIAINPDALTFVDLSAAVKAIAEGDTNVTYSDGSKTDEQRLTALTDYLISGSRQELAAYRRFKW